jgi:hypothetical protein
MGKFKLLFTTLPIVILITGIALLRDYVLGIKGIVEFSDISPFLSTAAIIIGFMLAGVLADYKESEKIPSDIATTLETIGETVRVVIALNKDVDVSAFDPKYRTLVATVEDWFLRRVGVDKCYAALEDFNQVAKMMHQAVGVNYAIRCLGETHNLRRLITRVEAISRTSFLPAGYVLLDLLVGTTLVLLLIANYRTVVVEYFLISLFSLIYVYLIRLIHDVDNPFEYVTGQKATGSAEVDPLPVQEYRQRLEKGQK